MKITEETIDLRVRRTLKLLSMALIHCLKESTFTSITVNQICEQAMVHRTTFYKHFTDKFSLLSFTLAQLMKGYLQMSAEERLKKPLQSLFIMSDGSLIEKILLNQKDDKMFYNFSSKYLKDLIKEDFLELKKRGKNYTIPIELLAEFHSGVISSLILWWSHQDGEVSLKQLDKYYYQMINKKISLE
ncbi:TetR/AcrR family transcriptional regulator [Paenibacillus sp. JNUCC31]|uniref:TetR/AcrR family transcriptional regulator n=1 Tax=Paenibacillus sp. JNUCC-31 TaxID=2777983 RepID=UPI00177EC8FC|nr:TetR/AcrR family transcriptional regulator [Paenibacillus sp. JNUCC-31]QOS79430.1 TetR/AcrR family transcriptional regulator [Paenibacillus sp. JNUCC-31]